MKVIREFQSVTDLAAFWRNTHQGRPQQPQTQRPKQTGRAAPRQRGRQKR